MNKQEQIEILELFKENDLHRYNEVINSNPYNFGLIWVLAKNLYNYENRIEELKDE